MHRNTLIFPKCIYICIFTRKYMSTTVKTSYKYIYIYPIYLYFACSTYTIAAQTPQICQMGPTRASPCSKKIRPSVLLAEPHAPMKFLIQKSRADWSIRRRPHHETSPSSTPPPWLVLHLGQHEDLRGKPCRSRWYGSKDLRGKPIPQPLVWFGGPARE
jgi:hypothetical protein